jgi:hypothetical protein
MCQGTFAKKNFNQDAYIYRCDSALPPYSSLDPFNHEIKHTGQLWRCIYKGHVIVLEKKKNHKPQVICIVVWYIYAVFSLPVTWYSDQNVIVR